MLCYARNVQTFSCITTIILITINYRFSLVIQNFNIPFQLLSQKFSNICDRCCEKDQKIMFDYIYIYIHSILLIIRPQHHEFFENSAKINT